MLCVIAAVGSVMKCLLGAADSTRYADSVATVLTSALQTRRVIFPYVYALSCSNSLCWTSQPAPMTQSTDEPPLPCIWPP